MTDTASPAPITIDTLAKLGQKRVNDTRVVEIPALGGTVVLRQLSGADQDAAVALGGASGAFDQHAVAREQIRRSLVEPALPDDEAYAIIDNLPVQAFGQLQAAVQANSGLLPGVSVDALVRSFRDSADAGGSAGSGEVADPREDALDADGLGSDDADGDSEGEGVSSVDDDGARGSGEEAVADVEAGEADAGVTA